MRISVEFEPDSFGHYLMTMAALRGMSLPELADAVGRTQRNVLYWSSSEHAPSAKSINALSSALKRPAEEIIDVLREQEANDDR